ncbi:MAG TPA: helix-turn-helix transcriptional regulator [Candidatus Saccharimonadales bacterium]|jgi:transcriptional regulator with XRE-family HTH domain|nr:helix-turn-helix transcriptional regulator [Candidatus Saccharimonadales bacterium]
MTDKITLDISKALKDMRQDKRMTQLQVAKKAGINVNYYAKLEQAVSTPSIKMLKKVVVALGVHSSDVLPF